MKLQLSGSDINPNQGSEWHVTAYPGAVIDQPVIQVRVFTSP
jgi:hypothetical protein